MKKIIFLFFTVLWVFVFLFIFEISCRIYEAKNKPSEINFNTPVPFLLFRTTPSLVNREDRATRYNTNSFGFRGREFTRDKEKGTYRIIAIGDSCTFGVGVSDDAHTYPALLEKKLNAGEKTKRYEVINAGVPGYLCLQSLISFVAELADYNPDMIIVYTGWNDLGKFFILENNIDYSYEGIFVGQNRLKLTTGRNAQSVKKKWDLASLRMIEKWGYKIQRWKNKKKLFQEEKQDSDLRTLSMMRDSYDNYASKSFYVERSVRIYERCLDMLLGYANSRGIKVVVLTMMPQLIWPDMPPEYYRKVVNKFPAVYYYCFDKNIGTLRNKLYLRYEDIIKRSAKRNNCYLIDAAGYFPKDDSNISLFYDHVHLNDKGSELFSEIVYKGIKEAVKK